MQCSKFRLHIKSLEILIIKLVFRLQIHALVGYTMNSEIVLIEVGFALCIIQTQSRSLFHLCVYVFVNKSFTLVSNP